VTEFGLALQVPDSRNHVDCHTRNIEQEERHQLLGRALNLQLSFLHTVTGGANYTARRLLAGKPRTATTCQTDWLAFDPCQCAAAD
jgi:hypothetical protein